MQPVNLPLEVTEWSQVKEIRSSGEAGYAVSRLRSFGSVRIRHVECTPGFVAQHWCHRKHVLYCLAGEAVLRFTDGRQCTLSAGMSVVTQDEGPAHRVTTEIGALLFIVD
jgi:hypothetical protein